MPIATPPPTRTPPRTDRTGRATQNKYRPFKPGPIDRSNGGRDGWQPPSPQTDPPLPPAPLLNLPQAAALAAAAALWNWLNSRSKQDAGGYVDAGGWEIFPDGLYDPNGQTRLTITGKGGKAGTRQSGQCRADIPKTITYETRSVTVPNLLSVTATYVGGPGNNCGSEASYADIRGRQLIVGAWYPWSNKPRVGYVGFGTGWFQEPCDLEILGVPVGTPGGLFRPLRELFTPVPGPTRFPYVPGPLPEPITEPEVQPLPRPAPPLPIAPPIAPPAAPPAPGPVAPPEAPPRTTPRPRPMPTPLLPPTTKPLPPPQQTPNRDGTYTPLPPPGPTKTPEGTEDFLGERIGQPEQAPPPTLQGIASEVGRIEQKLRVLAKRPAGDAPDLSPLEALLQEILEKLSQAYQGGSYELVGPCEPALGGGPGASRSATWPGGVGNFASIIARVDALAELLQHHKDLRQPICRQKASGEEVTVIFEEIG